MKKATGNTFGLTVLGAGLLAGGFAARPACAQDVPSPEQLAQTEQSLKQRVSALEEVPLAVELPSITAGVTNLVPVAYGFTYGTGGVGVGYENHQIGSTRYQGAIGVVLGLGDPVNKLGFDVGFNDLSIRTPFKNGAFDFKIHRELSPDTHIAIGAENVANYGTTDTPHSYYIVGTQKLRMGADPNAFLSRWYVTLGAGDGRFRKVSSTTFLPTGSKVRPFGSVATNIITQEVNVFGEYNGQDVNVGLSIVPIKSLPLVITPSLNNITHQSDNRTRVGVSVGYAFNY